jgi:hypothetical protein
MTAREDLRQSFQLGSGASVTVRGISGPVTVETVQGSIAEVNVVRMAATERELGCYRTEISRNAGGIVIKHIQFSDRPGCNSIRSHQIVRLKVPRFANLHLSTIAGRIDVGPTDGLLKLDAIAGHATIAGARSAQISPLAQGLTLTLARLGPAGIQISSVVGGAELRFGPEAKAHVRVSSIQGKVESDWPARGSDSHAYQIGSGGPAVSISSVIGPVRLRRF